jgi:hypothetical protein
MIISEFVYEYIDIFIQAIQRIAHLSNQHQYKNTKSHRYSTIREEAKQATAVRVYA